MNGKKHVKQKRRMSKPNPKLDRGSQHRKNKVGKSNIAAKRVTLLPGFLINGFTSDTAKKSKSGTEVQKTNDHLLTENLQAFMGQKTNLRRSQRILRRYNDDESVTVSSKSSTNDQIMQLPTTSNALPNVCPTTQSFKSILKKNAKSIFKEISDKFSKVHIQNKCEEPKPKTTRVNNDLRDFGLMQCNDNDLPQLQVPASPENCEFSLFYNHSFCENFSKKIRVSFKKNAIEDCLENIKKEINTTNLILEGKIRREETESYEDEDNDSEEQGSNTVNVFPIPSRNWVYRTPVNQKINVPQPEECQLKPALLCANNNSHDLYEIKPKHNLKFSDLNHVEDFSENNMFFKKLTVIKRTPANLGPRVAMEQNNSHRNQADVPISWSEHQGCASGLGKYHQQLAFEIPSANILSHPVKTMMPIGPCYQEEKIPINTANVTSANNFCHNPEHDFTFIEDGNHFKIQESQSPQRTKRRSSEENDYVLKRVNYGFEPGKCDKSKMFDFSNSQERNMFDFGVISHI